MHAPRQAHVSPASRSFRTSITPFSLALLLSACPTSFAQDTPDPSIAEPFSSFVDEMAGDQLAALEPVLADMPALTANVEQLTWQITPLGQFDYRLSLDTALTYRDYQGTDAGDGVSANFTLGAQFDFALPRDTLARNLQSLERARRGLTSARVLGVRDSLLAHADLLVRQEEHRRAIAAVDEAGDDADRHVASLELREAELELAEARNASNDFGIPAIAEYRPVRFLLPDLAGSADRYAEAHDYRILLFEREEAAAELEEAGRVLDDLRLGATYRVREGQVRGEGGFVNGLPGASVTVSNVGGPERLELRVSAQVVIGDELFERHGLERELELVDQELATFPVEYRHRLDVALQEALISEEWLTLAEAQVREAYATYRSASSQAPVDRAQLDRAALDRAARSLSTERLRLYRAWSTYVRAVAAVLELTGNEWIVAAD